MAGEGSRAKAPPSCQPRPPRQVMTSPNCCPSRRCWVVTIEATNYLSPQHPPSYHESPVTQMLLVYWVQHCANGVKTEINKTILTPQVA